MDEPLIKMKWEGAKGILVFGSMKIACVFDFSDVFDCQRIVFEPIRIILRNIYQAVQEESEEEFDGI